MPVDLNAVMHNVHDDYKSNLKDKITSANNTFIAEPVSEEEYKRKIAYCKGSGSANKFDHLTFLARTVDKQDPKRCGWVYNNDFTKGTGAFGSINNQDDVPGEEKTPGEWMWNLDAARKRYHIDHCTKLVTNCRQIANPEFNKKCAWCKQSKKGVPIDLFNELAYPEVRIARCSTKSIIRDASKCNEGFTGTILPNTPISRNQIYNQIINPGDYETGAINYSLNVGSQDNSFSDISKKKACEIYQKRALYPLNESALTSNRLTEKDALNGFERKVDHSISGANNSLVFSGRNLSCNKGINDKYDFGVEAQFNLIR
jgi:hypothetical protein